MTEPTPNPADPARAIAANAANVIETTRRAWLAPPLNEKPKTARRPMQGEHAHRHEFLEARNALITIRTQPANPAEQAIDVRMHDTRRFPLVRLRRRAVQPGYAFAWRVDMQRLLSLNTLFVIVSEHHADETADDIHLRGVWLRSRHIALGLYCRGLIVIEPRIEARATTREAVRAATQGSGIRTVLVSSMRVANELAPVLLKHSANETARRKTNASASAKPIRAAPL
jgi:hypothetical protein